MINSIRDVKPISFQPLESNKSRFERIYDILVIYQNRISFLENRLDRYESFIAEMKKQNNKSLGV